MSTGKDKDKLAASLIDESAEELYEHAPCGYLSTLPNGTIVKINATLLQWLGYKREEILFEKKLQDFFTIGGKIFYETHHAPLLRMQGRVDELNYELMAKNRSLLPVLLTSQQLRDQEGNAQLNRVTIFNITDRKKYELELLKAKKKAEEASKAKAQFLSTVSHEFRTPMNAIIGVANLLQKTELSPEQLQYIDILKFSSENLLALINDILDFSRIESGILQLNEKAFSPKALMHSIVYGLQHKATEKGLSLNVKVDQQLPEALVGDPVKIGQVLTNLLSNAIKFTDKGKIRLRLKVLELLPGQALVEFKVKDSGIGIREDQQGKIFEAFTQANPEINLKYGGSGLGLSISQQLLKMYGSKLQVRSQPGKGSEFSFKLRLPVVPLEVAAPVQVDHINKVVSAMDVRGVLILLAEDNAINVLVVTAYLKEWGVLYDVVENGRKAVEAVRQKDYDLVFMDLQMPEMDGYEATSAIRAMEEEKYKQLPVVAFTASAKIDYKERIAAAGITDLLTKPFREEELLATLMRYTRKEEAAAAAGVNVASRPAIKSAVGEAAAVLNVDQYRKITRNDRGSLTKLLQLTIRHFEEYIHSFATAMNARDTKMLGELAHKIKMTLHLLEADTLQQAIDDGRQLLQDPQASDEAVSASILHIQQQLKEAISELQKAL